uniref:Uncharacterized protein n=2 Tax=Phytophthora ramorum TaxID=164328 RepID=H3GYF8_PHYRM
MSGKEEAGGWAVHSSICLLRPLAVGIGAAVTGDLRAQASFTHSQPDTMSVTVDTPHNDVRYFDSTWLQIGQDLRTQRWKNVVNIDRMLRNHRPHEVLTHVEQNTNWYAKTFTLALKVERLIFESAVSRESYLDEKTLRGRVAQVSRRLIGLRKRKNVAKFSARLPRQFLAMRQ